MQNRLTSAPAADKDRATGVDRLNPIAALAPEIMRPGRYDLDIENFPTPVMPRWSAHLLHELFKKVPQFNVQQFGGRLALLGSRVSQMFDHEWRDVFRAWTRFLIRYVSAQLMDRRVRHLADRMVSLIPPPDTFMADDVPSKMRSIARKLSAWNSRYLHSRQPGWFARNIYADRLLQRWEFMAQYRLTMSIQDAAEPFYRDKGRPDCVGYSVYLPTNPANVAVSIISRVCENRRAEQTCGYRVSQQQLDLAEDSARYTKEEMSRKFLSAFLNIINLRIIDGENHLASIS